MIVLLPFLVLVWTSLQKYYSAPSWEALSRLSFDNYRAVLDYPGLLDHGAQQPVPVADLRHHRSSWSPR